MPRSPFDFDAVIEFKEWVRTIYHHAASYNPPIRDPKQVIFVANELLQKVIEDQRQEKYAEAYFYTIKCLQLFDKEKRAAPKDARGRKLFESALTYSELLLGGLQEQYQETVARIQATEPERRRLLAQQLEEDTSYLVGNKKLSDHDAHESRRKALLHNEKNNILELRHMLSGSPLECSNQLHPPQRTETVSITRPSVADTSTFHPPELRQPSDSKQRKCARWQFQPAGTAVHCSRRGIINLGNTCYMNSILQIINGTPLAEYFLSSDYMETLVSQTGDVTRLVNSFSYIIRELRRSDSDGPVSTSPFKLALSELFESFNNSKQQDANEFLRALLDSLHSGLNRNHSNMTVLQEIDNSTGDDFQLSRKYWWQYSQTNDSVITEFCAFQERSSITCPSCGHCSRSFTPTFGVEVPIPSSPQICVEDCLDFYCTEEVLGADSLYLCPNCKNKVQATKQLLFYTVPKVLFITLKRFRTYGDFSNLAKINDDVSFQSQLNLGPYMCSSFSNTNFNLVGVVNHQGNVHGGHYTADSLGRDSVWCSFSDEVVSLGENPLFSLGYILCYVRAD